MVERTLATVLKRDFPERRQRASDRFDVRALALALPRCRIAICDAFIADVVRRRRSARLLSLRALHRPPTRRRPTASAARATGILSRSLCLCSYLMTGNNMRCPETRRDESTQGRQDPPEHPCTRHGPSGVADQFQLSREATQESTRGQQCRARAPGRVPSSMKRRACVKVTDCARLGAWPLAAARARAETLQSSIRPRGAGRVPCGARGLNQVRRPSLGGEARFSCELARAVRGGGPGRGARSSGRRALIAPP
jgi:hypothetical protein